MSNGKIYKLFILSFMLPVSWYVYATTAEQKPALEAFNTTLVQQAFDNWQEGRGSFFDLLAEDAVWTVAGSSPASGIYDTREALLKDAVYPIHARLTTSIVPTVTEIIASHDRVVVFWDGSARAQDGSQYVNSYAWHLVMAEGKITQVTAYLDTWALNQLMDSPQD